ncbi:hypothetical protein BDD12DRAFT_827944 [Trichophaea hybrida]|nr:hypothetical protein BDD12DRAFT_827944 [Trichophaea hybrida]
METVTYIISTVCELVFGKPEDMARKKIAAAPSTGTTTNKRNSQTPNPPDGSGGRKNNPTANTFTDSGDNAKSNASNEKSKHNHEGPKDNNGKPQTNPKHSQASTVGHQPGASSNKLSKALTDSTEVETLPRDSIEGQNNDPNGGSSQLGMPSDPSSTSQPHRRQRDVRGL